MISNKVIFDKANSKIVTGDLSALEITQLSSIDASLAGSIFTVDTFEDLPNVTDNTGRLVYVIALGKYYFSNGNEWSDNYSTQVTADGIAYAWGYNGSGQVGNGETGYITSKSSPVSVIGGITNWSQVSAGVNHGLGVTSNGIAYAWGLNGYDSRLGNGETGYITSKSSPVSVVGGITNWSQVSAGQRHSLGVTSNGIAYGWGYNGNGRLGDGTTTTRSSPVSVIGGITNWAQVSASTSHSLGVTSDGIAYAWGYNGQGRLGDGTTTSRGSPVSVIGGITNWSQVDAGAGAGHSLGVTSDGIAYGWGYNGQGRLGDGTTTDRSSPVSVIGGITNWSQVSAGNLHSLGVTSDGIAYGWGFNGYDGRLGIGEFGSGTSKSSPVSVIGGITNWSQVDAGAGHSLGVTSNGIAYAWGLNSFGPLGDGTETARSSPVSVIGGITNWAQVSAGDRHSLGVAASEFGFDEP